VKSWTLLIASLREQGPLLRSPLDGSAERRMVLPCASLLGRHWRARLALDHAARSRIQIGPVTSFGISGRSRRSRARPARKKRNTRSIFGRWERDFIFFPDLVERFGNPGLGLLERVRHWNRHTDLTGDGGERRCQFSWSLRLLRPAAGQSPHERARFIGHR